MKAKELGRGLFVWAVIWSVVLVASAIQFN
ncbi:hypothetical protein OH686_21510 [Pseudomonas sp. SO81]|nr:hypothetical protein OH686_21510 [Pseudomonas sp. SO81]